MGLSIPQMALMSQLLDEALPLDEAGRRAWLAKASQQHPDLAAALRDALPTGAADAADVQELLNLPKLGAADQASAPAASGLRPGARVGPYELIRLLGAGGMAEVWLARRADGALKREVALKLPMLHRLQAGLEVRFARERDILAGLEHPHIARLYDAGVDPQGLPYLAMEYVQGEPLTDWCDAQRLGIPERLGLFLQVLEAVQYAHGKRVIHRDLKPPNILVTDSGQVRLLDFGVARLLEVEETDKTALTSVYGRALTPDYASPELLRGGSIDARSDLYSLGVLLYELLTGNRPYRLKSAASIGMLDQAIATLEVDKPSMHLEQSAAVARASTVERLARQLRGDLDAIVLMALAKDPAQRYPSTAAMADDLRRYLAGQPVQARPARLSYKLRKFLRRNAMQLGVSAMALAAILAAIGYARYRESLSQVTVSAAAVADPISEKSIAVLPFVDLSEHQDQEYFSDGLSEELIDLLTKVPELHVPARTSSFYFKGQHATTAEMAKALGVAYLLEGSVRKSGNTVRVTAELIRANNGFNAWSETYDRDLKDIFKIQDEIAGRVVSALQAVLPPARVANTDRSANTEAYNQYLLGRRLLRSGTEADLPRASEAFRKATTLDPEYADAFSWLGTAEATRGDRTGDGSLIKHALAMVEHAIALEPEDPEGYTTRGWMRCEWFWDWEGARQDLDKAKSLEIGFSSTLESVRAQLAATQGHLDEAIAILTRSSQHDPLDADGWFLLVRYLAVSGNLAQARAINNRIEIIEPDSDDVHNGRFELDMLEGNADAALVEVDKLGSRFLQLWATALVQHSLRHESESQRALDELIRIAASTGPSQIAQIYAWRGERDQAFAWYERAYRLHDAGLSWLKYDPWSMSLRGDARYKALLAKMKLPL